MLRDTGIDGGRRGETMSMEEFAALSRAYGPIQEDEGNDKK